MDILSNKDRIGCVACANDHDDGISNAEAVVGAVVLMRAKGIASVEKAMCFKHRRDVRKLVDFIAKSAEALPAKGRH